MPLRAKIGNNHNRIFGRSRLKDSIYLSAKPGAHPILCGRGALRWSRQILVSRAFGWSLVYVTFSLSVLSHRLPSSCCDRPTQALEPREKDAEADAETEGKLYSDLFTWVTWQNLPPSLSSLAPYKGSLFPQIPWWEKSLPACQSNRITDTSFTSAAHIHSGQR